MPRENWPVRESITVRKDLVGLRFGETVVTELWGRDPNEPNRSLWLCKCDCGTEHLVRNNNLRSGNTRSCGHLHTGGRPVERHGYHNDPTYANWEHMIDRCENPNNSKYALYGGRGITVCDRWRNSFSAFLEDMGDRPHNKSIDRIDSNKGYSLDNCRWATVLEQNRNLPTVMRVEFRDEGLVPVVELADRFGISKDTLKGRVRRGVPIERALVGYGR